MNKIRLLTICLVLVIITSLTFATTDLFKIEKNKDLPKVLNPDFIKCVKEKGKIDLLDRESANYNSKALVDGSLKECDK